MTTPPGGSNRQPVVPLEPEWDRVTFGYQFSLVLVALVIILLPLCYFALVGGAIATAVGMIRYHELWLRSWTEVAVRWYIESVGPSVPVPPTLYKWVIYAYNITIGLLFGLVFFMIKHVLHASRPGEGMLVLARERQPRLWGMVEEVSRLTGAPMPEMILVSRDINASACSILPWWNPFGEERLILTIGLPLIAILNKRELAGVIAHELGHFSQHTASWLHGLIHRVLDWFNRVVHQKDKWDDQVVEASLSDEGLKSFVASVFGSMVFLSRCFLMVLQQLGQVVACFMLQRMELDADRFPIRLVGSQVFEDVLRKLPVMGEAFGRTMEEFLIGLKHDKAIPDDFPGLCARKYVEIPPDLRMSIWQNSLTGTTGLFDTHPCGQSRVEQARTMNEPGIFNEIAPAREMLSDLQDISIAATHSFYEWSGMLTIPGVKVRFLDPPKDRFSDDKEVFAAAERVFHGNFLSQFNNPLPVINLERQFDPELIFRDMVRFQKSRRKRGTAFRNLEERQTQCLDLLATLQDRYLLDVPGRPEVIKQIRELSFQLDKIALELRPMEEETKSRVLATLCLLLFWNVSLRLARRGYDSGRFRANCSTLSSLAEHAPTIREMLARTRLLEKVADRANLAQGPGPLNDLDRTLFKAQHDGIRKLHAAFRGRECFSPKEKTTVDLGDYLIVRMPGKEDLLTILATSKTMDQRYVQLYCRVLGEIAIFIEQAEILAGVDSGVPAQPTR